MDEDEDRPQLSSHALAALQSFLSGAERGTSEDTVVHSTEDKPDFIPLNNALYKEKDYWDERFEREDAYDWLLHFEGDVQALLVQNLQPSDRILMVGCGNSGFSAELYDHGYKNIVNIDFSEVVISKMRDKYRDRPEMSWRVMDMKQLQFEAACFDVVIDKAAMDVFMCDIGDVWDPQPHVWTDTFEMCSGISRVLKPTGRFLQISFDQPHFRRRFLDKPDFGWTFAVHNLGVGLGYFLYAMVKTQGTDETL
eukprot:GILJ01005011.1.p1 GENE.GILJ01005011.1~~GILJ01005011.1.p1  ORF type:complete len:252 (-),score=34.58 GILJ01005011.1:250-1005(-)